jgi:hypothetical protein
LSSIWSSLLVSLSPEFLTWLVNYISRISVWLFSWFLHLYWIPLSYPALSSLFYPAIICILLEFFQVFMSCLILLIIHIIILLIIFLEFHPLHYHLCPLLWSWGLLEELWCLVFFFNVICVSALGFAGSWLGVLIICSLSVEVFPMLRQICIVEGWRCSIHAQGIRPHPQYHSDRGKLAGVSHSC